MAIADLLLTLFGIVPGAVSLAANDWILGDVMCYLNYFIKDTSALALYSLTTAIATTKMLMIKYPLRAINFSTQVGHVAAFSIWITSSSLPAAALLKDNKSMYFDYLLYTCDYTCVEPVWNSISYTIYTTLVGLVGLITVTGTVVSSVWLLVLANRATAGGGLRREGVLTVILTAGAHSMWALPLTAYYVISEIGRDPTTLYRWAWWISELVVIVNFYVLSLTLPCFRDFLKTLVGYRSCLNGGERSQESEEREGLMGVQN